MLGLKPWDGPGRAGSVWVGLPGVRELVSMIGENRQFVTNEPVEVQHCREITGHCRGIYRIYPNLIKENRRMSTL